MTKPILSRRRGKRKGPTIKQERFAKEYLKCGNQREAYRRAYDCSNMKETTIAGNAAKLMQHKFVSAIIEGSINKGAEAAAVDARKVLDELTKLAFFNIHDIIERTDDGQVTFDWRKLQRDHAAAITELVIDEYMDGKGDSARPVKRTRAKFADKRGALVDIGRHLGMFVERHEVGRPGDFSALSDTELAAYIAREAGKLLTLDSSEVVDVSGEQPDTETVAGSEDHNRT